MNNRMRCICPPWVLALAAVAWSVTAGITRAQDSPSHVLIVPPSATLSWDQLKENEARAPAMPEGALSVHPPRQTPGPIALDDRAWRSENLLPEERGTPPSLRRTLLTAAPPVATASFEALPDNNTRIPPDTHGSAGPLHLMTMLNTQVRIQDKSGTSISTTSLFSFWAVLTGNPFDPRVHYDATSGRWIAACVANAQTDSSEVYFAISAGSDPTGAWTFYRIDADPTFGGPWADFPTIGFSNQFIAITANMFQVSGTFAGAKMWVLDKAGALAGGAVTVTTFAAGFDATLGGGISGATLYPCVSYGSTTTLYIVDNTNYYQTSDTTFLLRLSRLTGAGTSPTWAPLPGSSFGANGLVRASNNFNSTQIAAPQGGSIIPIATNDKRIMNAVYRNGRIWCTHSAGLPAKIAPAPNRTAAFWYEINPAAMPSPIVQSGVFDGGAGVHHTFPSVAVNSANDVLVGFTRVDGSRFAEAVFAGRRGTDPAGSMTSIGVLKAGMGSYTKFFSGSQNRWGDYSNTSVDPVDDVTLWTIQEYAAEPVGSDSNSGRWGTWWGKIDPAVGLPVVLAEFTAERGEDATVVLRWVTLSESNTLGFEIERAVDESVFGTVPGSFTPGRGTALGTHHYQYTDRMPPRGRLRYRLRQQDLDGEVYYSDAVTLEPLLVRDGALPLAFALAQNYPNPFNPRTTIRYTLPERTRVVLIVMDLLGQEVATLVDEVQGAGEWSVTFDGGEVASGAYVYRLMAGTFLQSRRMMLLR